MSFRILRSLASGLLIAAALGCSTTVKELDRAPSGTPEILFKDIDARLERDFGIPGSYEGTESLRSVIEALATESARRDPSRDKVQLEFLGFARSRAESALSSGILADQVSAFLIGKRVLHGVLAVDEEEAEGSQQKSPVSFVSRIAERVRKFEKLITRIGRVVLQDFLFSVPHVRDPANERISAEQASREASTLRAPDGARFLQPSELQGRTHAEVSELDVADAHPVWHPESTLARRKANSPDLWKELERRVEEGIQRHLARRGAAGQDYRIGVARRVLVFDEIKTSATSPKVKTQDAFGQTWTLKWGDEIQTEPVTSRLWIQLGGKLADLNYANGRGARELVLVLADPHGRKNGCDAPRDADALVRCLDESKYRFNLRPYIEETGILTEANIHTVLAHLPESLRLRYLQRGFVTFRESSQELRPAKAVFQRGGAVPFSSLGSLQDRVARGLLVLNAWIGNTDAKDDNNIQVLMHSPDPEYVEYQHDLGATLGGLFALGDISKFTTGDSFASTSPGRFSILPRMLGGNRVYFKDPVLYYPRAWEEATFADARWMALKITRLDASEMERAVAASNWPTFAKRLLLAKLIERRNQLAQLFVPEAQILDVPRFEYAVSLDTPETRRRTLRELGQELAPEEESELERLALQTTPGSSGTELVVNASGEIAECRHSVLVRFLERERHPSGLGSRVGRLNDGGKDARRECRSTEQKYSPTGL